MSNASETKSKIVGVLAGSKHPDMPLKDIAERANVPREEVERVVEESERIVETRQIGQQTLYGLDMVR